MIDKIIDAEFTEIFESFKTDLRKKLKLDRLAEHKFVIIQRMAKNLTAFVPDELRKCPERTETVTVEWVHEKLKDFLVSEVSCFIVDGVGLSQLEKDVQKRRIMDI